MPIVVISAVNFTEGGPLQILRDCLTSAADYFPEQYEIVAIVNDSSLVNIPRVRLIAIPSAKKSWLHRLYWEWFGFMRISREFQPLLWFSLHDITPRVMSTLQAVYCHNPSPFYKVSLFEAYMQPSFLFFNLLYSHLYSIFIRRNAFVVVQQSWLREEFLRRFGPLPIVVAHPSLPKPISKESSKHLQNYVFVYPAFPRVFKNVETLCKAVEILFEREIFGFEVKLTLSGSENRYSRWLFSKYRHLSGLKFIGRQSQEGMGVLYSQADALVFPSKLETWGLPISEAKAYRLPLLLPELPYARETVGNYDLLQFFCPESSQNLADIMESMIRGIWSPSVSYQEKLSQPFASNWENLWKILTKELLP
jgi:glycosyltransferase involved in cell wall biosynthesis